MVFKFDIISQHNQCYCWWCPDTILSQGITKQCNNLFTMEGLIISIMTSLTVFPRPYNGHVFHIFKRYTYHKTWRKNLVKIAPTFISYHVTIPLHIVLLYVFFHLCLSHNVLLPSHAITLFQKKCTIILLCVTGVKLNCFPHDYG